jgi:hypothetical protein
MGKKLETIEERVIRSLSESMQKLSSGRHSGDLYEHGYAQALADVKALIADLK